MNARDRLSLDKAHLSYFCLDSCRSEIGRSFVLRLYHPLSHSSTNVKLFNCQHSTWCPHPSSQRWSQMDHVVITHKWPDPCMTVGRTETLHSIPTTQNSASRCIDVSVDKMQLRLDYFKLSGLVHVNSSKRVS